MAESERPDDGLVGAIPDAGIDLANPVICRDDDGHSAATELWDALFEDIDGKAREVLADMARVKATYPKAAHMDWKWWAYSLTAYAAFHGRPVPASLLQLLFEAMNITPGYLPDDVKEVMKLPLGKIADDRKWRKAVEIQAAVRDISENALAKRVGVDRKSIREWRASEAFQNAVVDERINEEFDLSLQGKAPGAAKKLDVDQIRRWIEEARGSKPA